MLKPLSTKELGTLSVFVARRTPAMPLTLAPTLTLPLTLTPTLALASTLARP